MRPSVRGAEGIRVVGTLALAAGATGALLGLVLGVAWELLGGDPLSPGATAVVVVTAVVADVAHRLTGRPRPLAVNRQVPQVWGRLFGAGTTALLYGARLGVGPLTILTSWTWWAAVVVGATLGPWASAGVGVAFAVARVITMVAVVAGTTTGTTMVGRMATIRSSEPAVAWATMVVVGIVGVGAAW